MLLIPPASAAAAALFAVLFARSSPSPDPAGGPPAPAIEARDRAAELAAEGRREDAAIHYEDAIWLGRRAIVEGRKEREAANKEDEDSDTSGEDDDDDNVGDRSIHFLASLYRSSALNRLSIPDLDGARTEAWAACVHAQSLVAAAAGTTGAASSSNGGECAEEESSAAAAVEAEVAAQAVLAAVCRAGDDPFGESQAWRRILELTATWDDSDGEKKDRWDGALPGADEVECDEDFPRRREDVEGRLRDLEEELKQMFGGGR